MEYIAQIFTGGWHTRLYETGEIIRKIQKLMDTVSLRGVIMGWYLDPELYLEISRFLKGTGVELYLWLPAFSEIGELGQAEEAVNLFGTNHNYQLQEGESFQFYCPSSQQNLKLVTDIYDRYFVSCGFQGVFLDKVRGQSFATGAEDVFGCCCSRCKELLRERGADCDQLKEQILSAGISEVLRVRSFTSRGTAFAHGITETFFEAKKQLCSSQVIGLVDLFHRKGLKVGLDLYAPSLCSLVGQDFDSLCSAADFVKPMMYRRTQAPAGIGFELEAFRRAVKENEETNCILRQVPITDDSFLRQQLLAIPEALKDKTCPGLEINYREDIAKTDPEYVSSSLQIFKECGISCAVLSWDVMLAPAAHIKAAAGIERKGV